MDENLKEKVVECQGQIDALQQDFLSIIGDEPVAVAVTSLLFTARAIIATVKEQDPEYGKTLEKMFEELVQIEMVE